jgi:hypothetical protein
MYRIVAPLLVPYILILRNFNQRITVILQSESVYLRQYVTSNTINC